MSFQQLYCLWHDGQPSHCAGVGLPINPGQAAWLVGLFSVSGPYAPTGDWFELVQGWFGGYETHPMDENGRLGIACQMYIEPESRPQLKRLDLPVAATYVEPLRPLQRNPPRVRFRMRYLPMAGTWVRYFKDEKRPEPPALSTLIRWLEDGGCEATDGCTVEPDGRCPHGKFSWLVELGII